MAFSMIPLLNGERAVVLFFITSVLVSLPFSLLYHGLALSLLTLSALCIEIQAESSNSLHQFKTRYLIFLFFLIHRILALDYRVACTSLI